VLAYPGCPGKRPLNGCSCSSSSWVILGCFAWYHALWLVYFQICKRRSKVTNAKSPGPPASTGKSSHRPYKHLILLPFSAIKRVVDICETPGASRLFLTGLICMCSCTIVPYTSFLWFCCLCKSNESFATWFSLRFLYYTYHCFDAVGWVTGRTSSVLVTSATYPQKFPYGKNRGSKKSGNWLTQGRVELAIEMEEDGW